MLVVNYFSSLSDFESELELNLDLKFDARYCESLLSSGRLNLYMLF